MGKQWQQGRGWSHPANHPWWLLCCRNMKAILVPLLSMNIYHTTTSKRGLLLLQSTKVFLDIMAAESHGGAQTLPTVPN